MDETSQQQPPTTAREVGARVGRGQLDFRNAKLSGEVLVSFKLAGADFSGADLRKADLRQADLTGAIFRNANMSGAKLGKVPFDPNVRASGGPIYHKGIVATDADFSGADLSHADLSHADLTRANLEKADLRQCDLTGANVTAARYKRSGRYLGIKGLNTVSGDPLFQRFAKDQEYIEAFRKRHPVFYALWLVLTDCGRSFLCWFTWIILLIGGFGLFFSQNPHFFQLDGGRELTGWTYYYFAVVTFTTLGFGDVTPSTLEGEIAITIEVVLGYVMLGALISIMANKVARRS